MDVSASKGQWVGSFVVVTSWGSFSAPKLSHSEFLIVGAGEIRVPLKISAG